MAVDSSERDHDGATVLYVCEEHLELAIDMIVDEYEKAPEILTLEQSGWTAGAGEPPPRCARCDRDARYTAS